MLDLSGNVYKRLTVVDEASPIMRPTGSKRRRWNCVCICGKSLVVEQTNLRANTTKSCGCYGKEQTTIRNTTHGLRKHPLYTVWVNMRRRCSNKKSKDYIWYGARGVRVCCAWRKDFLAFYTWATSHGYAKGLQIDRKSNDGHYTPDNCRFVTNRQNTLNQRHLKSDNKSGFRGVCYQKQRSAWESCIRIKGKLTHLGCHNTIRQAVQARNEFIINNKLEHDYALQNVKESLK